MENLEFEDLPVNAGFGLSRDELGVFAHGFEERLQGIEESVAAMRRELARFRDEEAGDEADR